MHTKFPRAGARRAALRPDRGPGSVRPGRRPGRGVAAFLLAAALAAAGLATPRARVAAVTVVCEGDKGRALPPPEFFAAALEGNADRLVRYLRAGVSPDASLPQPLPAEFRAALAAHLRAGFLLRDAGVTALMLAAAAGQTATVGALVNAGASPETHTARGTYPLDLAALADSVEAMQLLLGVGPNTAAGRLAITVDLDLQRATLTRDGEELVSTPISSGRTEKPTPRGTFVVTQKYTTWRSTLYHNAAMPFFLRLSCSPVGLHAGHLPGYPASHGCIRLPESVARKLFTMVPRGTLVTIR